MKNSDVFPFIDPALRSRLGLLRLAGEMFAGNMLEPVRKRRGFTHPSILAQNVAGLTASSRLSCRLLIPQLQDSENDLPLIHGGRAARAKLWPLVDLPVEMARKGRCSGKAIEIFVSTGCWLQMCQRSSTPTSSPTPP